MKLLILNENYPHSSNLLGDVFVHVRAQEYQKVHEVMVASLSGDKRNDEYEGIRIEFCENECQVVQIIQSFNPDRILIHFYESWMLRHVVFQFDIPVVIWVHGHEALGWYRRLFNHRWYSPYLYKYMLQNTIQQFKFRRLVKYANRHSKVRFVFVSKWMKNVAETDALSKIHQSYIIPNPIAIDLFPYRRKDHGLRKKILILRSFSTHKYANDISVKAILKLKDEDWFNDLSIRIIGDGQLFGQILEPIKDLPNITIERGVVKQRDIPSIHAEYGIFLCPTRQDAQGVSMCEAMSSGLVPITSDNTAIPEFVDHRKSGIITNSVQEVAEAIEWIYKNPDEFRAMSARAAESMKEKCNIKSVTKLESSVIEMT